MRREFSTKVRLEALARCQDRCESCGCDLNSWDYYHFDHVIPDQLLGANDLDNCQVLCRACHRLKTKADIARIAKAKRQFAKAKGMKKKWPWPKRRFGYG
jgi:5-methylcytosine-specific restriction endonuclease McrA